MHFVGADLGSRSVKLAIFDDTKPSLDLRIIDTIKFYREYGTYEQDTGFRIQLDFIPSDACWISTGYGRNNLRIQQAEIISEFRAHTLYAIFQTELSNFILLDLGGQDSKVVFVEDAQVANFVANERCAASTGRYLENMARVLGMSLQEMSIYYKDPINLSSTCAIFGESELIGHLARGESPERLAAGVNHSIVKRFLPLTNKYPSNLLCLSGGVAKNKAIVEILKNKGYKVIVLPLPQYSGALGTLISGLQTEGISSRLLDEALQKLVE